jgi:cation:H+ antiporter
MIWHNAMLDLLIAIISFCIGVLLLYKGSDILVEGTTHVVAQFGVSSLIISVIIVAFGTSAPEFAISVGAAAQEYAGLVKSGAAISLGNIIGSCIANFLLVIGISAIIKPIKIKKGIIKREMPIVVLVTFVLLVFVLINLLDAYHLMGGFLFLIFFVIFIWYFIQCAKRERIKTDKYEKGTSIKNGIYIVGGIIGVVLGAWFLIESAITIADFLGIPALIISLSMVAIGTSLPELVVSAMASYRNKSDIAIGNVLGSNVFNILLILGAAALFIPLKTYESINHIILLMIITLVMVPVLYINNEITRRKGIFLIIIYGLFIWYTFSAPSILI